MTRFRDTSPKPVPAGVFVVGHLRHASFILSSLVTSSKFSASSTGRSVCAATFIAGAITSWSRSLFSVLHAG
jgi:hypothetical protein